MKFKEFRNRANQIVMAARAWGRHEINGLKTKPGHWIIKENGNTFALPPKEFAKQFKP